MNCECEDAHQNRNSQDNELPGKPSYFLSDVEGQGDTDDAHIRRQHDEERIANNRPRLAIHQISKKA